MKRLLTVLFLPFFSMAQRSDFFYFEDNYQALANVMWENSNNRKFYPDFYFTDSFSPEKYGLSSAEVIVQVPKKEELKKTSVYNSQGLLIQYKTNNFTTSYTYKDTLLVEREYNYKRRIVKTVNTYVESKLVSSQEYSNDKLKKEYTYVYDRGHCIKSSCLDYARRKIYVLNHFIDESTGKMAKAEYYINGKLKKRWDFTCSDRGIAANPKVDAVGSYCTYNQENNDGSYSVFIRAIRNGKVYLEQSDYNSDSLKISMSEFLNDTILVRRVLFTGNKTASHYYSDKGKLRVTTETETDSQKRVVYSKSTDEKGRLNYLQEYSYLENGLVENINYTFRKGYKITNTYAYTYF